MKGEAGRILKCISKSRKNAEECVDNLVRNHDCIILTDYDDGDEAYVQLVEEQQCYDLYLDETEDEEDWGIDSKPIERLSI